MRLPVVALTTVLGLSTLALAGQKPAEKSVRLESMAWPEAEKVLAPERVVVIPLGAGSKEHGPHLKLRSDLTLAEYLTQRVFDATPVVVAPTLNYHHYPAFLEYPGSTSLSLNTARDMTADVVRTLAAYGPRRFYILNTGVSTVRALQPAVSALSSEGVLVRYTDLQTRLEPATRGYTEQPGGTHADEVETSMMLYIDPAAVDMSKAVKDFTPSSGGLKLTRQRGANGTYSPTGIWGDPTFATKEKGRVFVEALVAGILKDISDLRTAPLPARTQVEPERIEPRSSAGTPVSPKPPAPDPVQKCSSGDERAILSLGFAFASYWANADARSLSDMWTKDGDIIHPDGAVEHGPPIILSNRLQLFARSEYRNSKHPIILRMVRCITSDVAIADGTWELRGVLDRDGKPLPKMEGQVTLVLRNTGSWRFEAYRYTLKPPGAEAAPAPLPRRPGGIDPS